MTAKFDAKWYAKFEKLVAYQQEHGHCSIPQRGNKDPEIKTLSKWIRRQRERYAALVKPKTHKTASRPITNDEIAALESIGFVWNNARYGPDAWSERYNDLKRFIQTYGHARVPQATPILGEWVQNQRRMLLRKQQGLSSTLNEERIQKLNDVEFLWKPQLLHTISWETYYDQLEQFQKEHGKQADILRHEANSPEELLLKYWVRKQLVLYYRFVNSFNGITHENIQRIEKLSELLDLDGVLEQHLPLLPPQGEPQYDDADETPPCVDLVAQV